MNAAAFVGRLGPLAAALGIGAAVLLGEAGIAGAEVGDTDDAAAVSADRPSSTVGRTANRGRGPVRPGPGRAAAASPRAVAIARAERDVLPPQPVPRIAVSEAAATGNYLADPEPTLTASLPTAPVGPNVIAVGRGASLPSLPRRASAAAMSAPLSLAGIGGSRPPGPIVPAPASALSSTAPQLVSAAAVGNDPISSFFGGLAALFNNQTPRLNPTQLSQSPSGVVSGQLGAVDPDSPRLTFTVTGDPVHGSAEVNPDGSWTYTPQPSAAVTGIVDSFRVTVSDAASGFAIHGLAGLLNLLTFGVIGTRGDTSTSTVAVTVTATGPANNPPTVSFALTGSSAATGVVTGMVVASDADGDTLSYGGSTTTAKGSVIVDSASGAFTYTPTTIARQNAAAPGAAPADLQDSFTVTVVDGHGGTATADVTVAVSPTPSPSGPLAAFPGAEGFGAYATGGRGGSVVYVTNLNADGPGSLQWAVDQPGAKYVLFKVSGLIDTQIHLTNGDVTIAGQTSPGGITIRGLVTDETPYQDQTVRVPTDFAENWILQHIRIRPGATGPSDDGLRLRYTRNAIVDHVSIGNATDEAIEISYSNNITVQNTIIAETVGGHSFYGGVLMNYSNPAHGFALDNVSLHHNVFNRIEGRLPEGSRESAAAANSFMNLELSNNLYWDPRFFIALGVDTAVAGGQPIYWKLNAVNNFFRTANGFQFGMFDDQILNVGRNELFISGNTMSLYPSRSDYQLFYCCNDYPSEASPDATSRRALARPARHPFPAITYTPTDQLRTVLLNTGGAWPRDPMDIRLMQSVASNTISSAPIATNPANDALLPPYSGAAPAPPADTDSDGMPDTWEIGKGLNPAVANHNARTLSSAGYTDLEVYLQELSTSRIGSIAT